MVIPLILTATHKDVFDMPTTPTTEMTVLFEKRVRGVLRLPGWKRGLRKRRKSLSRWLDGRGSKSKLGSCESLRRVWGK